MLEILLNTKVNKLTFWNNLASNGGDIQYPDPLLLALVQGGLRDKLSGLEPEPREGEKAVIFTSRPPWVLPFRSHKRSK